MPDLLWKALAQIIKSNVQATEEKIVEHKSDAKKTRHEKSQT